MKPRILEQRWPWLAAAALVVVAFALTVFDFRFGGPDTRPTGDADDIEALAERDDLNVLFILVDTLRAEHLGMYGYARDTSPILDEVAARGVMFARQMSQSSWTKCSMASLWTGLYPARTGVTRFNQVLPQDARMPAEVFKDAGFQTAGFFRNGWVEGYFGFDQGFDTYSRPIGKPAPATVRRENPTLLDRNTDLDLTDAMSEFLRIRGHRRWFLYLHLMDVHEYLYDEKTALFGTGLADIYDNAVRRMDYVLSQAFIELSERGYLEKTLVVIAADHGEAFGERGREGHARRVYRETTEVPLVISFPFRLDPGVIVESRTRNVDIWPTILDLVGLPPLPQTDGVSRKPEILAAARGEYLDRPASTAIAHLDQTWGRRQAPSRPTVAVADGPHRFVVSHGSGGKPIVELFDSTSDPAELHNVAPEQTETANRLAKLVEEYLASEPPWESEVESLELDEMQLQQLRALGYKVP